MLARGRMTVTGHLTRPKLSGVRVISTEQDDFYPCQPIKRQSCGYFDGQLALKVRFQKHHRFKGRFTLSPGSARSVMTRKNPRFAAISWWQKWSPEDVLSFVIQVPRGGSRYCEKCWAHIGIMGKGLRNGLSLSSPMARFFMVADRGCGSITANAWSVQAEPSP